MLRRVSIGAVTTAILLMGCDASSDVDAGPSSMCLTNVPCLDDADCAALPGHRCNTSVPGGACQMPRCTARGDSCSDDADCVLGDACVASRCAGCTMCGADCVFLDRDDQHCGTCGNVVSAGQACVDGVPGCPTGRICFVDAGT